MVETKPAAPRHWPGVPALMKLEKNDVFSLRGERGGISRARCDAQAEYLFVIGDGSIEVGDLKPYASEPRLGRESIIVRSYSIRNCVHCLSFDRTLASNSITVGRYALRYTYSRV
jgi:hypothetical protein